MKVTQRAIDEILARIPPASVGVANIKDMFVFPDYFPPFQFFLLDDEGRMHVRTFKKGKAKGDQVLRSKLGIVEIGDTLHIYPISLGKERLIGCQNVILKDEKVH